MYRTSNADEERRSWDPYAHARTTIGEDHRMIHDGAAFTFIDYTASLANGASRDILLVIPAGCYPHFRKLEATVSDGPVSALLYEDVTTSADGTPITTGMYNNNRASTNVSKCSIYHTPTVTDLGTMLHQHHVFSSGAPGVANAAGVLNDVENEIILKAGTKYLLRLTNTSGAAISTELHTFHYEIPDSYVE